MRITVASGKGGTGKTTVAVSLAVALAHSGRQAVYLDCDVEEPNGHVFLTPAVADTREVTVMVPSIATDRCLLCGLCADFCAYNALALAGDKIMVFNELCHGCGGCVMVCPEGAMTEATRPVGELRLGEGGGASFVGGWMNVGEAQAPPVIKAVKENAGEAEVIVADAPPGTSCPAIEAVSGSDYVLLVTEPTPFGLHDLEQAMAMVAQLGLPQGVVINRCDEDDAEVERVCRRHGAPILARIPFDRDIAEAYSRGRLPSEVKPEYDQVLLGVYETIAREVTR